MDRIRRVLLHNKMNLIEKSLSIALQAHSSQTDKAGRPYILDPLRIMAKMGSNGQKIPSITRFCPLRE